MKIDYNKLEIAQARSGKAANELGVSYGTLGHIKEGREVHPKTVYKCATALGCTIDDILADEDIYASN